MLRRFQPISRAAQWSDVIRCRDVRSRDIQSFDGVVLTMGLYQHGSSYGCRRDYGRLIPGFGNPVLAAATRLDGSGSFAIAPDNLSAPFAFQPPDLSRLWPGDALFIVWATANGVPDEILRATIRVLDGPTAIPVV